MVERLVPFAEVERARAGDTAGLRCCTIWNRVAFTHYSQPYLANDDPSKLCWVDERPASLQLTPRRKESAADHAALAFLFTSPHVAFAFTFRSRPRLYR